MVVRSGPVVSTADRQSGLKDAIFRCHGVRIQLEGVDHEYGRSEESAQVHALSE